jgi:hypothetical protein
LDYSDLDISIIPSAPCADLEISVIKGELLILVPFIEHEFFSLPPGYSKLDSDGDPVRA